MHCLTSLFQGQTTILLFEFLDHLRCLVSNFSRYLIFFKLRYLSQNCLRYPSQIVQDGRVWSFKISRSNQFKISESDWFKISESNWLIIFEVK